MMTMTKLYARTSALPAIAAALALSSTQSFAQEVPQQAQPVTTEPAPATAQPAPVADEPAPATDTSAAAPATSPTPVKNATRTVKHNTHITASKPAATVKQTITRTVATSHLAAPPPAPAPVAPAAPTSQSKVAPVVDLNAKPGAPAQTTAAKPANQSDETLEIAGGALALLALGAGAAAVARSRRRRREEQEWADEQTMAHEPFETVAAPAPAAEPIIHEVQPATVAPSAFAWGDRQPARANEPMVEQEDRRPGETWIERAYRGPSRNNPSVSLRARLKRAAFFDKREREAAAGTAEPVDLDAGLPDAMVEEQERALA